LAIDPNNTFALTNKAAILDRLGNHTTTENATTFVQYENSSYGIKMQYPSDWQSVGGASNSSIVASFNPQRNYASYMADAPRFTDYLPTVQEMIDSLQIKSQPRNAK
jgi:hypothetical protein